MSGALRRCLLRMAGVCLILLGLVHPAFSHDVSTAPGWKAGRQQLNTGLSYLVDPGGALSAEQVLANRNWQKHQGDDALNFGFTDATLWVRALVGSPALSETGWYLVIPYPLLEQVSVTIRDAASGELLYQGDERGARRQDSLLSHFHFLSFPVPESASGRLDILIRAESSTSLQLPLEVWSEDYLVRHQVFETLFWGLYFGIILALAAYNLFLAWSVREASYVYYVLYLVAIAGVMLSLSGLGTAYFWPENPTLHRYFLPAFTVLGSIWALLFARSFLFWQGHAARLDRTMAVVAVLSIALMVFCWLQPRFGAQVAGWTGALVVALILVAGIRALAAGVVIARYFVMAWAVFALGAAVYLLNIFGVIPATLLSNHALQIGSALEAVLLSLALAHRIREERWQKIEALQQRHRAERRVRELQLQSLENAMHDPVTRMPNESLLISRLQGLMEKRRSGDHPLALIILFFPQIKEIASSLGRHLSETLFRSITRDLNHLLVSNRQIVFIERRTRSCLAVLEQGTLTLVYESEDGQEPVRHQVGRLLQYFDTPVDVSSIALNLDAFAGVAFYPEHGERADILLQHASAARDVGLRIGERICFYNQEMDSYGRRRLALMGALSRAIKEGELELYLQPQLDCDGLHLVGAEILLRWDSPKHGRVPTQEFIEIAESAGLMSHLTRYVFSRSLDLLQNLQQNGMQLTLSINLSVQNLIEPDFVQFVTETARRYQVSLSDLILEVTETTLIEKIGSVVENLEKLTAAGCRIALDDFGTGYSSLAYLSRLPIHELKIDRSFISQMGENLSDLRIVENTVKLARTLQIQTVAEGVEDSETLNTVVRLGCNRVQGYHIGRPMPLGQFYEWALGRIP